MGQRVQDPDNSVITSLDELMSIEGDRIRSERVQRHQARLENERKRAEAEERAKAAERARIASEKERRAQEQAQRDQRLAQLEAFKEAEVERIRRETEHQLRMQELASEQAHERALVATKEKEQRKDRRLVFAAIAGLLAIATGVGGYFVNNHVGEQNNRIAALEKSLGDAKA